MLLFEISVSLVFIDLKKDSLIWKVSVKRWYNTFIMTIYDSVSGTPYET